MSSDLRFMWTQPRNFKLSFWILSVFPQCYFYCGAKMFQILAIYEAGGALIRAGRVKNKGCWKFVSIFLFAYLLFYFLTGITSFIRQNGNQNLASYSSKSELKVTRCAEETVNQYWNIILQHCGVPIKRTPSLSVRRIKLLKRHHHFPYSDWKIVQNFKVPCNNEWIYIVA